MPSRSTRRALLACCATAAAMAVAAPAAVATFPGAEGEIAFVRGGDIWAVGPDGSGLRQVVSGPREDAAPAWAPDGRTLAFARLGDDPRIWTARADGGRLRRVGPGLDPAWAPGGRRLAFVRERPGPNPDDEDLPNRPAFVMDRDGSDVRRIVDFLPNVRRPDWSPAGGLIALEQHADDGSSGLRMTTPRGDAGFGPFLLPPHGDYDETAPSWSPDGERLLFRRGPNVDHPCFGTPDALCADPQIGLWTVAPDGSDPMQVPGSADAREAVWSPDGERIAFVSSADGELWVMDADGTGRTRLTGGGAAEPDWRAARRRPPAGGSPVVVQTGNAVVVVQVSIGGGAASASAVAVNRSVRQEG